MTSARDPVPRQGQATLDVEGLTVRTDTGQVLLHDFALSIKPGESVGVVGQTGAGKSVLVRALLRLLPETLEIDPGSRLEILGESVLDLSDEQMRRLRGEGVAAILPGARAQLNPAISVGELMVAAMRAHKRVSKRNARDAAVTLLNQVGITDSARRLKAYPHELSGGMAQRVCIALALMHNPRLIIADEPTAGLDVTVQRQVLTTMDSLTTREGAAQLVVTRDLGIVAHFCSRMVVMKDGHVVDSGDVKQVFDRPQSEYTAELIAKSRLAISEEAAARAGQASGEADR